MRSPEMKTLAKLWPRFMMPTVNPGSASALHAPGVFHFWGSVSAYAGRGLRGSVQLLEPYRFALKEGCNGVEPSVPRKYLVDYVRALLAFFGLLGSSECVATAQSGYAGRCCSRRGPGHAFLGIRCIGNIPGVNPLAARAAAPIDYLFPLGAHVSTFKTPCRR